MDQNDKNDEIRKRDRIRKQKYRENLKKRAAAGDKKAEDVIKRALDANKVHKRRKMCTRMSRDEYLEKQIKEQKREIDDLRGKVFFLDSLVRKTTEKVFEHQEKLETLLKRAKTDNFNCQIQNNAGGAMTWKGRFGAIRNHAQITKNHEERATKIMKRFNTRPVGSVEV